MYNPTNYAPEKGGVENYPHVFCGAPKGVLQKLQDFCGAELVLMGLEQSQTSPYSIRMTVFVEASLDQRQS
jgi:hypothetical protein